MLADFDELVGLFRTRELVGRVRIDMSSSLAKRFFIPMLPSFTVAHPRIEVELSATDRFVDPVREGVDLVIRAGTLADSSLVVHPVGRMTLLNVVSRDYARRRGVPRTLDELDDHFVVGYASASDPEPAAFEWLDGEILRSRPMRCSITVGNTESYTDACFAGLGLVQAPRYTLVQHLSAGTLVEVLPTHRARPLPLSILHAQRRQLSRRARALLDHVAPLLERDVCV